MPRNRMVKPEFWTNDKVVQCTIIARAFFLGMLNFADDNGNIDQSTNQLKLQIFPADEVDVGLLVDELIQNELVTPYEVGGKKYLHINGFRKHQQINRPSQPRCPPIDSVSTTGGLPEDSPRKERKEKEYIGSSDDEPPEKKSNRHQYPDWFHELWRELPRREGTDPKWDAFKACRARLREGATEQELIAGAKRYGRYLKATGKAGSSFQMQTKRLFGPNNEFENDWAADNVTAMGDWAGAPPGVKVL